MLWDSKMHRNIELKVEHLEQGRVLRGGFDTEKARESFLEVIEIADLIIAGHDNLLSNPTRKGL